MFGPGVYYKYVMTYSSETITQVDVYDSPSHIVKTITTKNALDSFWAFDTTTGYGPFNSCYAAINVSDGTVAFHLQPNNLKRQLGASSDMTAQELANYNIVWLIPTVYWSATSTTLTLTNSSTEGGTAYAHSVVSPTAKTYPFIGIGVYEASTTTISGNTALMSQSGKSPANNKSIYEADEYGQNTPGDAILWNFYHWTFTKMATYMVGMGKNTQQIWGAGNTSGSSASTTGLGDTAGSYVSGQTTYSKVFIENSWGSVREWVGSTYFNNRTLYLTTTTGGNSYSSDMGTSQGVNLPSIGWITGTSKASATWDLPTSSSSTDNSTNVAYPGDRVYSNSGVRVFFVSGEYYDGTEAGVSYAHGGYWSTNAYVGGRLAYYLDADAASTTTVPVNVGGTWKDAVPYINVNGTWKEATPYINVNGAWKEAK